MTNAVAKQRQKALDCVRAANDRFRRTLVGGAVYIKNSSLISRLNQRGFKHIESIVRRGKEDGTMRSDITPLDVYINLVGMCYYHAANRTGYLASFKGRLNEKIASEAFHASRKRAVIESVTRYALVQI